MGHVIFKRVNVFDISWPATATAMAMANTPLEEVGQEFVNTMTRAAANAEVEILRGFLASAPPGTVNRPNKYGRTAIQGMNFMSPSTALLLLDHGADPNVPDPSVGRTILHDIAENGCVETFNILLAYGADQLARDNRGNTPGHLAAANGEPSRIQVLEKLAHLSNLREPNNAGQTPLDLAVQGGKDDVINWLRRFFQEPRSLMFYARIAIRTRVTIPELASLRGNVPEVIVQYLEGVKNTAT